MITKRTLIIDVTGIELTPGNLGKDCLGNGNNKHPICCDSCDYLICCLDESFPECCLFCTDIDCPRK